MCQERFPASRRTDALSILARIIAKDILRKSVCSKGAPMIVPRTPDKKASDDIEDKSDEREPK
jgi:hypothetical protein